MRRSLLILFAATAPLAAQNAPVAFEAARTAPLSPGQWTYAATVSGSEARFGGKFLIRCDRSARRVSLLRTDIAMPATATPMTVTTDLATHTVPANGPVTSTNRLLDAMAFSRGRFLVDGGGSGIRLVVPASPEAARTVEDCRN